MRRSSFYKIKYYPAWLGRTLTLSNISKNFFNKCNGKAPKEWVSPAKPQTAAWAAVDLALLDAFGHEYNEPIRLADHRGIEPKFRYSPVVSTCRGLKAFKSFAKVRLYGFRQVKLKIEEDYTEETLRFDRRLLGKKCDIRVDVNMAWDVPQAIKTMKIGSRYGVHSYEQPLAADDVQGLAQLVQKTGLDVMVDESLHDAESLDNLIAQRACTAVNIRISKCGGLMASFNRYKRAIEAGLSIQVGCQVGETSLLSAAQLILIAAVKDVKYAEGCFGLHLLREDPVQPLMQFGYGGRPPAFPQGPGLGVSVNESMLNQWCAKKKSIV